ncbi:hypothetical protein GEMRC1_007637 [Eukaryota sp. GEM-RC1]
MNDSSPGNKIDLHPNTMNANFIPLVVASDSDSDSSNSDDGSIPQSFGSLNEFVSALSVNRSRSDPNMEFDPLNAFYSKERFSSIRRVQSESYESTTIPIPSSTPYSSSEDISTPLSSSVPVTQHSFSHSFTSPSASPLASTPSINTSGAKPLHASRTLFLTSNFSMISESFLFSYLSGFGDIRSLFSGCKDFGFCIVTFYDLSSAINAHSLLSDRALPLDDGSLSNFSIGVKFSVPIDSLVDNVAHHGTLVVFNLSSSVLDSDLLSVFGAFGPIKEIRQTPHKNHHRFIEFFDIRHAEAAQKALNKTEIYGRRVKIEPSRPGGRRFLQQQMLLDSQLKPFCSQCDDCTSQKCLRQLILSAGERTESGSKLLPIEEGGDVESLLDVLDFKRSMKNSNRSKADVFVPKKHITDDIFDLNVDKIISGEETRCTIMIRNIPNKYQSPMLLNSINNNHSGTFNFFYLPIDFKNLCNYGYAFINFRHPSHIISFFKEFNGKDGNISIQPSCVS